MSSLLIDNVTLLDGTGATPRQRQSVIVQGARINWIGASDAVDRKRAYDRTMDGRGKYLMPGLIDAHVHICFNGHESVVALLKEANRDRLVIEAVKNVADILNCGTTTVRDIGGYEYLEMSIRRAIDAGTLPGPRMRCAGRVISMTGGHAHFIAREADGPDEVRKAARENFKAGADLIKVMATGGAATPGQNVQASQLSVEEMKAAVDEAVKLGKTTAAHCHGTAGIMNATLAGITSIEHCSQLTPEVVKMMKERGTWAVFTFGENDPDLSNLDEKGKVAAHDFLSRAKPMREAVKRSVAMAAEAGIPIGSGTDAGGNQFAPHGDSMPHQLEELVAHGFTPLQAIQIVTQANSRLLQMENDVGAVEVGKFADLLLLNDNPASDVANVRKIAAIFKSGVELVREK